ncbi:MAG: lysine--tRNA ligase [Deltaproteobacteria bacterium]|nr:MAG: lysine--tRNA ligase [Pseudomonadota bacterium]PIE66134.1 MAG: lysine--tRNA ligase [Deltaproteobacteria bacterium]
MSKEQHKQEQPPPDENKLIEQRKQKVAALREAGENPYRNDFLPTHSSADVRQAVERISPPAEPSMDALIDDRFRIAGRIVEFRSFGKATFAKLLDRGGRQQVYVRRDVVGEDVYKVFKKAEPWDFICVEGYPFYTKTGELTVMAEKVALLTKAVRPPPAKWEGLKDQETRYRQRYVDLVANPNVAEVFRKRTRLIRYIRAFLDEREFLEVETPILHATLGGAAAKPFATHHNALNMPLYMRIAPELYLKRLVVGGFDRVYEIGRNFRNEGLSRNHNPEFTMLEFYMGYATYETLIELTEEMLTGAAELIAGTTALTFQGQTIDVSRPWPRISVKALVLKAGQKLAPALDEATLDDPEAFTAWIDASGLSKRDDELGEALRRATSYGKRLGVIFDQLGEEEIPHDRPVFVIDYPAAISPLARRKDANPEYVDRFELFFAGREVANAFSELNDPEDQRGRFQRQVEDRKAGDDEAMEYDEDYCRALEYGMPPTAGEGIGIDRLLMMLTDQPSIRDVLLFPHMRAEGR